MGTIILSTLRGVSLKDIEWALTEWHNSIPGMVSSTIYGFGFTLLGGYVAAKISNTDSLLNSLFVGGVGILVGMFFISETPMAIFFLSILLPIPVSTLGGFWYTKKWKLF
jgi:hypothetical protein